MAVSFVSVSVMWFSSQPSCSSSSLNNRPRHLELGLDSAWSLAVTLQPSIPAVCPCVQDLGVDDWIVVRAGLPDLVFDYNGETGIRKRRLQIFVFRQCKGTEACPCRTCKWVGGGQGIGERGGKEGG